VTASDVLGDDVVWDEVWSTTIELYWGQAVSGPPEMSLRYYIYRNTYGTELLRNWRLSVGFIIYHKTDQKVVGPNLKHMPKPDVFFSNKVTYYELPNEYMQ
jgi:hypothetical protein